MLIMSGRIEKRKPRAKKTEQKDALLAAILSHSVTMPSCSYCEGRGLESCEVSPQDSSRCAECVRLGRSRCDVQGVAPEELRRIAAQHQKLEDELQAAEEKVLRLRKQKRMWYEKMMRAVRRGIDSVEELDRIEREEAAEEERRRATEVVPTSSDIPTSSDDFMNGWDGTFPEVDLDPSVLAQFGFADGRISTLPSGSSGGQ